MFVPLPSSPITTFDETGGTKTAGGINAKLFIDYDLRRTTTKQEISLNRVDGSWTPTDSMYYLTDRKVNAHSGTTWGDKISRTPSSNSFSYATGFGYNVFANLDGSPRAWSTAVSHITGMSATYEIEIEFIYPE